MIFHNPLLCLRSLLERYAKARAVRHDERLRARIRHEVQVAEFDGSLYVTFRGVPIVKASDLALGSDDAYERDLAEYAASVREDVLRHYRLEEAERKL